MEDLGIFPASRSRMYGELPGLDKSFRSTVCGGDLNHITKSLDPTLGLAFQMHNIFQASITYRKLTVNVTVGRIPNAVKSRRRPTKQLHEHKSHC